MIITTKFSVLYHVVLAPVTIAVAFAPADIQEKTYWTFYSTFYYKCRETIHLNFVQKISLRGMLAPIYVQIGKKY